MSSDSSDNSNNNPNELSPTLIVDRFFENYFESNEQKLNQSSSQKSEAPRESRLAVEHQIPKSLSESALASMQPRTTPKMRLSSNSDAGNNINNGSSSSGSLFQRMVGNHSANNSPNAKWKLSKPKLETPRQFLDILKAKLTIRETITNPLVPVDDRPSGAPPRTKEEEERHRKHVEEMQRAIQKSVEKEEKQKQRRLIEKQKREVYLRETANIWLQEILPNWEESYSSRKTRQIWSVGLPPRVRGAVWERAIGNALNVTVEECQSLHARAVESIRKRIEQRAAEAEDCTANGNEADSLQKGDSNTASTTARVRSHSYSTPLDKGSTASLIDQDVSRTFITLQFFQEGGPYHEPLQQILEMYVLYRPDVGYVQGMSYIAAMLLLNMDLYPAFVCFANLLNSYHFISFFRSDTPQILFRVETFLVLFREELPQLYSHFREQEIKPHFFIIDWFLTLFCKSLPLDVAARLWDLFLLDGECAMYRGALAILRYFASRLLPFQFEHCMKVLSHLPQDIDEIKLFNHLDSIKISDRKLASSQSEATAVIKQRAETQL